MYKKFWNYGSIEISNFWKILAILLTNCEFHFITTWPVNCVISNAAANQGKIFAITDTKRYVPLVTLSTEDNGKLLQQLESGFKRRINWNKYHSKTKTLVTQNLYLNSKLTQVFRE